jgi:predicted RNase H-like HicB family nuclease
MSEYLVILERAPHNWAAYSPDLPGCIATGRTREQTMTRLREAIQLHIEGLREDGLPIPAPESIADYIAV